MDPVAVATLGAAVVLAAPIIGITASPCRDFGQRLDGIEKRIDGRLGGFDAGLQALKQGLAEVKGKLAFVETCILRCNRAGWRRGGP